MINGLNKLDSDLGPEKNRREVGCVDGPVLINRLRPERGDYPTTGFKIIAVQCE